MQHAPPKDQPADLDLQAAAGRRHVAQLKELVKNGVEVAGHVPRPARVQRQAGAGWAADATIQHWQEMRRLVPRPSTAAAATAAATTAADPPPPKDQRPHRYSMRVPSGATQRAMMYGSARPFHQSAAGRLIARIRRTCGRWQGAARSTPSAGTSQRRLAGRTLVDSGWRRKQLAAARQK